MEKSVQLEAQGGCFYRFDRRVGKLLSPTSVWAFFYIGLQGLDPT
jgi:hypothetical protein